LAVLEEGRRGHLNILSPAFYDKEKTRDYFYAFFYGANTADLVCTGFYY